MSFEAFLGILNNAAFLLALGVLYNTFSDAFFSDTKRYKTGIGIIIGLIGMAVMLNPWDFGNGVIFDTRSILLSVSALFFGPIAAVISTAMTSSLRIYQGGAGAPVGVGVIMTSSFLGLMLRYILQKYQRKVQDVRWYELFGFGVIVHLAMILWMFMLPGSLADKVVSTISSPVITVYPIVTIFLGLMLSKQLKKVEVQKLLQNSEIQFKRAEKIARLGHWAFDLDTKLVHASESALDIYGLDKYQQLTMRDVQKIPLTEYREVLDRKLRFLVEKREPYDVAFVIKRPCDGKISYLRSIAEYDPEINVVFGVIYDETERKTLLDKIEKMDKIESLGVLAGGLAHDFNNLLSGIFGNIEMALDQDLPTAAKERLIKAVRIYHRAESLTRQLLTFAKGGAPEKRLGKIEKTLRESILFAMTGTSIVYEFNILEDLHPVEYDKNQMSEVFSNIAINAQQAMKGRGVFTVNAENIDVEEHTTLKNGKYIKISLVDNGPGIEKDILGKIFDPFFSTKDEGNGLGLATSFSILKKHEGLLEVDSFPGEGAAFNVYLPATDKVIDDQSLDIKITTKGDGTILIMDDEDFIRSVVGDMVSSMGFTPITVGDGKDAVDVVKSSLESENKISMIFLDLTVPGGVGGAEVVEQIKTIAPDIPVIASSGYSDDPVISNPKEHGFDDSIKKPFLLAGLSETIKRNTTV